MTRILALLAEYPEAELERRKAAMRRAAEPGGTVEFDAIAGSVYRKGLTNLDRALVAPAVAAAAMQAEAAGFDAVVPYGTLDLGVEEARHVVRIPVVGTGRAATHLAATLCERFAIVCYDVPHVVMYQRLVRAWRVADFVTSIRPIDVPVTEMSSRPDEVRRRLVERARQAIAEDGAELILPLGLTMVPVTVPTDGLADDVGAPVLDPLHIAMQTAILLAGRDVPNSRLAYPAAAFRPPGARA